MRTQHKTEYHRIALLKSTGKPISIEKADRGLKCNAVCPECEKDFVAAQGEKKEWYFRHNEKTNCKGGQESALHKLAKEIICRNLDLQVTQKARIQYSNPVAEINQDEFRPDITAKYGEEILYFEVVVSNPVSPKKANKYISYEIKTIVIDLSKYEYQTEIELEKYIIENTNSKKVLFWVK
ncbi:MAG: competence protein CoiA family protein, partial [Chitinophagales bacterium]